MLYTRVSSKEQEREGFSIPAQQRLLQKYADDHGLTVVHEYVDVETAKREGRSSFTKMLAWLKKNRQTCRVVLVEKTDRLYRNLKDWVIIDELDLEIHLVKEGVILSDDARSTDKFMHGIRVLMAKNYIDNLSEEAAKGMREKAAQGHWPSRAPIGYLNVTREDGKRVLAVDPTSGPLVHQMFELAANGQSPKAIAGWAATAGVVSRKARKPLDRSAVYFLLRNPIYMGEFEWAGKTYQGKHEPVVTRELWEKVQDMIEGRYQSNHEEPRVDEFAYPGMIQCGHCGCVLSPQIKKEKYRYYRCTGFKGDCGEPYLREEFLDEKFAEALAEIALEPAQLDHIREHLRAGQADAQRQHRESLERLEGECARLQRRLDQMYVDKLDGVIDAETYARTARAWQDEIRSHRRAMGRHDEAKQHFLEEGLVILSLATEASALFRRGTRQERFELLQSMVQNCSWAREKLTVTWRKPYSFLAESRKSSDDNGEIGDPSPEGGIRMAGCMPIELSGWRLGRTGTRRRRLSLLGCARRQCETAAHCRSASRRV